MDAPHMRRGLTGGRSPGLGHACSNRSAQWHLEACADGRSALGSVALRFVLSYAERDG